MATPFPFSFDNWITFSGFKVGWNDRIDEISLSQSYEKIEHQYITAGPEYLYVRWLVIRISSQYSKALFKFYFKGHSYFLWVYGYL